MTRAMLFAGVAVLAVAACAPVAAPPQLGPDGLPVQTVYRITPDLAQRIPGRALDSVNTLRAQARLAPLQLNSALTAAAQEHSRDMSRQQRAWAFGSDGTPPVTRVARAGYRGAFLGQNVSETFENELETINGWMAEPGTRGVLMDPDARDMGLAWHQDDNGKLWWTLKTGTPDAGADPLAAAAGGPAEGFGAPGPFIPGVFEPM